MADRIALLRDGCLIQLGTSDDLYRRPKDIFAAAFFSEINRFSGKVKDRQIDTPIGRIDAAGKPEGSHVEVAVRLSDISVTENGGEILARVRSRRFLGVEEMLELAVPGSELTVRARIRADQLPSGLRDVTLSVNDRNILVFEKSA